MNLLFVFLKNIDDEKRSKLNSLVPRGTTGAVWLLIHEQVESGEFDKKDILAKTGISTSHLDKITSELLGKCYHILFGNDTLALLAFLSRQVVFIKFFYNELPRQFKAISISGDAKQQAEFIKRCFGMIHSNMPIAYRDEKVSARQPE